MVINRKVLPWLIAGIALAAILLIVLVMVTQAAPGRRPLSQITNLITNPGFEDGLTGWTVEEWDGTHEATTDEFICGAYSDHVEAPDPVSTVGLKSDSFHFNGGNLCLSAWALGTITTETNVTLYLRPGPWVIDSENVSSDAWEIIGDCSTVAAGDYYLEISIYNAAYIDSVWGSVNSNYDACPVQQGPPSLVSYQGQVNLSNGTLFTGTGYFKFAIVDSNGTFYWSNDGTDAITPTESITLTVVNGLFNTLLGETNPITYGVFSDSDRWLRVWFDDGAHGAQLLEPDTQFTTAPFAFQADHSTTADTATSATYAITAGDATTALNATNATTATYAMTALTATNATTATYATTALTATNATTATYATTALTATNATTATYATTALTATNATTATYATTALTATNATTATYATTALTCSQASGIAFPATQVPSADKNTLDDYEEGTFTVTMVALTSGTITLDINTLAYTKIGRVVNFTGYLHVSAVNAPVGHLQIQGLPFTDGNGDEFRSAVAIRAIGLAATATTSIVGQVNKNETTVTLQKFAAGNSYAMASDVQTNTQVYLQGTYFAQ